MSTLGHAVRTVLLTLAAASAGAGTIRIGGEDKPDQGKIVGMEAGDVACYMHIETDAGPRTEMAGFELCDQADTLIDKVVRLEYELGNVLADSCEGNPDCGKSQEVALVSKATPIRAAAQPASTTSSAASGFCSAAEVVVFQCRSGSKQISVCASKDISASTGYVQYRFGKPGARPEIILPPDQTPRSRGDGTHLVYGRSDGYSGGGASWLRFHKATWSYVVYTGIGRWGENGEAVAKAGVAVENNNALVSNVACDDGASSGELGPDWQAAAGFDPENAAEEFYIPD